LDYEICFSNISESLFESNDEGWYYLGQDLLEIIPEDPKYSYRFLLPWDWYDLYKANHKTDSWIDLPLGIKNWLDINAADYSYLTILFAFHYETLFTIGGICLKFPDIETAILFKMSNFVTDDKMVNHLSVHAVRIDLENLDMERAE
jgi:hypothetical protein